MRSRQTFAQALEEALDTARDGTPLVADRFVYLPASAAPFVFVYSRSASGAAAPARTVRESAAQTRLRASGYATSTSVGAATAVAEPPRPAATLTERETRAIDELIALGADFRHGFTARDLRREFRRLAREYHPDRHPGGSAAEQERLAQIFADLAEHYRCLAAVFERER